MKATKTFAALLSAVIFSIPTFGQSVPPANAPKITEEMVVEYLAKRYECEPDAIHIDSTQYFNFTGHRYDELIVVASTCQTGTAGPDVHSVFSWIEEGKLGELEFEEVDRKIYDVLLGNRNYVLDPDKNDRELIETFYDTSDRYRPLILRFQWDSKQHKFFLNSVQSAPTYKTSYDCARAREEVDRAICYEESLAQLDLELNDVYKSAASKLTPEGRRSLVQQQREWLTERERECVIYKGWLECLRDKYQKRIAELKKQ